MPTGRTGVKHDAVIQQTALSATARGSTIRRWVCTELYLRHLPWVIATHKMKCGTAGQ